VSYHIEHFLYGTPAGIKALRADLPDDLTINYISGGLILRQELEAEDSVDNAIARIEALAQAYGVDYDGYGELLRDKPEGGGNGIDIDIQSQRFTKRTHIKPGHGFAFDLSDGRFGHAVYVGSDRMGYLLLDISTLVTDRPASADKVREAPKRYRQPILVWHTPFAVVALEDTRQLVEIPREVSFRSGIGWPDPPAIEQLARRYGISGAHNPDRWNALLLAMAEARERLPDIEGYSTFAARVERTGRLKLIQDHETQPFAPGGNWPMPWQPVDMTELGAILAGAPDLIAARDDVT
jgi:hypothetical protein